MKSFVLCLLNLALPLAALAQTPTFSWQHEPPRWKETATRLDVAVPAGSDY